MVQALRLNTLSKLTFADSKRFDALVKDVFLGVPFKDVEHMDLENALREACRENNLVVIESQVRIVVYDSLPFAYMFGICRQLCWPLIVRCLHMCSVCVCVCVCEGIMIKSQVRCV